MNNVIHYSSYIKVWDVFQKFSLYTNVGTDMIYTKILLLNVLQYKM